MAQLVAPGSGERDAMLFVQHFACPIQDKGTAIDVPKSLAGLGGFLLLHDFKDGKHTRAFRERRSEGVAPEMEISSVCTKTLHSLLHRL